MKEKVLVVEDEAIVQLDIKNRLINLGYDIVGTTAYGEDAIKKVGSVCPDIVLMDIGLKGKIDGIETASQIKAVHNIPIIFMTANSDYTTLQKAKITSPFGYILKPFDEREMRTTIEMALFKHKLDSELNETRHWLETILNSISDAVISTNSQLLITFINPAAEAMTGWKADEAHGKNIHEVIRILDKETRLEVECPVKKVIETGIACTSKGMMTMVSRDGAECPADCTVSPIFDSKRKIEGVVFVFRDVTRQVLVEQALRESEEKFSKAFQYNPLPMTISRLDDGMFIDVNRRFIEVFGYTKEESIGRISTELGVLSPDDRAMLIKQIAKNGRISNAKIDFHDKNGSVKYGQVSYDIILINGLQHLLAIFTDNALVEKL